MKHIFLGTLLLLAPSLRASPWDWLSSIPWPGAQGVGAMPGGLIRTPAEFINDVSQFFEAFDRQFSALTTEQKAQAREAFLAKCKQDLETKNGADGSWRYIAWKLDYNDGIFKLLYGLRNNAKAFELLNNKPVVRAWWESCMQQGSAQQKARLLLGDDAPEEEVKLLEAFINRTQKRLNSSAPLQKHALVRRSNIELAQRLGRSLSERLQQPVTLASVGTVMIAGFLLRMFNVMRSVEDLVLKKEGWMCWKHDISLRDLQKRPADELLPELLSDIVRRYDVFDSLDDNESSLKLFLQDIEQEAQRINNYCTRARRLSWFKLDGLFGATPALLSRMEQGLCRLRFLRDLVLDHVVVSKFARNVRR